MQREYLKGLGLEDEAINKVMAEHGKSIQAKESEVSSLQSERDSLKQQLTDRDNDIEMLKKSNNTETLKQELEDLQTKYAADTEALEAKLKQQTFDAALSEQLLKADVRNDKAVKALLDVDSIKLSDNGLEGLEEQMMALKESDPYLFNDAEQVTQTWPNITKKGDYKGGGNKITEEDFNKMSYSERKQLKDASPELYNQLTQK